MYHGASDISGKCCKYRQITFASTAVGLPRAAARAPPPDGPVDGPARAVGAGVSGVLSVP